MPIRDLGVVPDYLDRAFRKLENETAAINDPPGKLREVFRGRRVQNADLAAIQAHRPLKRPGKGADFSFQSPMTRAVLFERAVEQENRRNSK